MPEHFPNINLKKIEKARNDYYWYLEPDCGHKMTRYEVQKLNLEF